MRFTNGYQDAARERGWNPATGCQFGYNDYTVGWLAVRERQHAGEEDKCVVYPGDQPIQGTVDQTTGTIR